MKKLTKKMISEAPKYMIAIDYLTSSREYDRSWRKVALTADNLASAMDETETYFGLDVYMINLLEKTGTAQIEDIEYITYDPVLATRNKGAYHRHDELHGERKEMRFVHNPYWAGSFNPNTLFI